MVGASGFGASSATSSSICLLVRYAALASSFSPLSSVRWEDRSAMPLRWSRPSPSICRITGNRRAGPCDRDAEIRLGLGEVQDFDAVDVHARTSLAQEKLPAVDFGDMSNQLGLDSPRLREEKRRLRKAQGSGSSWSRFLVFMAAF